MIRCYHPNCVSIGAEEHHITYEPPVIVLLCKKHHEQITIINGQQSRKIHEQLSNRHRWWIWYQWLAGKIHARKTARAMAYISDNPFYELELEGRSVCHKHELPVVYDGSKCWMCQRKI